MHYFIKRIKVPSFLIKNAAIYTSSNIINAAIPFMLLPILTRVLSPSDYGLIAMFTSTLGFLSAFTGLGAQGAINARFYDRENIDFPSYVGSCFTILIISTFFTLTIVFIFEPFFASFTAISSFWLGAAVLTSGCTTLIQIRLGIWLMEKRPFIYSFFQMSNSILNIALSLLLILSFNFGYSGRLWGQAFSSCVFAFASLITLYCGGWIGFRPSIVYIKEGLFFGLPLVPHVLGGFFVSLADRFIINKLLGLESAGIYMVAAQIGMGILLLTDSFNKAFVPWLYERLIQDDWYVKKQIVKLTWIYFSLSLVIAVFLALFSQKLVILVAGARYIDAYKPLIWLAFGQAFTGAYFMVTNYVFYSRRTGYLALITLLGGGLGLILTWYLVPLIGISGAGLSFAIAMLFRFSLTWYLANKVYPMPWFYFVKAR